MKANSSKLLKRNLRQALGMVSLAGLSVGFAGAQNTGGNTVQTEKSAPVVGKVVTPDGKPVKGAAVYWIERMPQGKVERRFVAETDAQGQFHFPETQPRPEERRPVTFMVQAGDWGLSFGSGTATPLAITVQPPLSLRVPFIDQAGKPIPNLHVRVQLLVTQNMGHLEIPPAMHGRWEQKTDAKGECVFSGLPQGARVRFAVEEEEFAQISYEEDVTLDNAATQKASPIRLLPGGSVQGRVVNGADGKPVAGVRVGAQAIGIGVGWGEAVTDANGIYRMVGLRPGTYNVALFLSGEMEKQSTARAFEKIDVKPKVTLEKQDFTLIPGSRIKGKVTDKSTGQPVAGVMIGIYGPARPRSGAAVQNTTTGTDGVYELRVPAGAQYVYVMGAPSNHYERPKEGVEVKVGEDASLTQDFTLTPAAVQNLKPIQGHVVGADGKPVPGAAITYVPVATDAFMPGGREMVADASGAFTLEMLSASVRLRARLGVQATESTLLAQSGDNVTLHLKPNVLSTMSGQVTDNRGKPLAGAKVTLIEWWLDSGLGNVTTQTDAQGRFTFKDLYPDARYSVSAEAPGYGSVNTNSVQYKPGEKAEALALQLPRADSFVTGRVVDDNGDPVAKQTVRLQGRTNKPQEAVTNAQGHFRFENVVDEPLTLYLYDDNKGFSPPKRTVAGDRDVILVRKAPQTPEAKAEQKVRETADRQRATLLSQPGPRLNAAVWLNTSASMPEGLKGKVVLIDFWAISCGPCVASLPAVQKASEQFAGRGVVVVGVHASGVEKGTLESFVHSHSLTYPMALDTDDSQNQSFGQIMKSYGVYGIPTVAVLDRQGIVRYLDWGLEGAVKVIGDLLASEK